MRCKWSFNQEECKEKKKETNQSTFIWHREITFHARIFGGLLRRCIILNNIPKSHHFIYIEISHRFHLQIKRELNRTVKSSKERNECEKISSIRSQSDSLSLKYMWNFACIFFHQFISLARIKMLSTINIFFWSRLLLFGGWPVGNVLVSLVERATDGICYSRKTQSHAVHENRQTTMSTTIWQNMWFY